MPVYKNLWAGVKQLFAYVQEGKVIRFPDASGVSGVFVSEVFFTQISGGATYTGSVAIPAGATVLDIQVKNAALWGGGTATMKVGDSADDDGYFTGIDMKATDLVVGEILSSAQGSIDVDGLWGGKQGAYLVAATGRRGTTTPSGNAGNYYGTADTITGIVTVGTPGTSTTGRTVMTVYWSKAIQTTPTVA